MVEAMIYVLRTGCPWRDLPKAFGSWSSVYTRWSRWSQAGVWAAILDLLGQDAQGKLRHLDSSHIKVHQDASNPPGGQENQSMGRTKGGFNSKVTALVDGRGRLLQLALAPGQRNDTVAAAEIVFPKKKMVVADKGYDSDAFRERIKKAGSEPCIPARSGRLIPANHHRGFYKKRHRVENFFQRLKRRRRIGTRYDKLDINFFAFLMLAAVLDWLTLF
jgi:transposase